MWRISVPSRTASSAGLGDRLDRRERRAGSRRSRAPRPPRSPAGPAAAGRTSRQRRGGWTSCLGRHRDVRRGAVRLQRVADVQRQRALRRRDAAVSHQADDRGVVLLAVVDLLALLGQACAQRADLARRSAGAPAAGRRCRSGRRSPGGRLRRADGSALKLRALRASAISRTLACSAFTISARRPSIASLTALTSIASRNTQISSHLARRQREHEGAALRLDVDQAVHAQAQQRLAHRRLADAELRRERGLGELRTHRQLAARR